MKRIATALIVVLAVVIFAGPALAKTFVMHPLAGQGVDASTANLLSALIRSELARVSGATVRTLDAPCHEEACAKETLTIARADMVLVGQVLKIGESHTLDLMAVWPKVTLKYKAVLEKIDEINRIAPRLAEAVANKNTFEQAITVTTVSMHEEKQYRKVQGDFSWGPSLGFLVPIGQSYGGTDILYDIELVFRYETAHLGFEFGTGAYFSDSGSDDSAAAEWPLDFAMMYFFSDQDHSAFVGGSFGLHYISVTTNIGQDETKDEQGEKRYDAWTPSVSAFGGYELLRTHTLHVAIRAGYRTGFVALDGPGAHGAFLAVAMTF